MFRFLCRAGTAFAAGDLFWQAMEKKYRRAGGARPGKEAELVKRKFNTRTIAAVGLLTAIHIVLSRFLSIKAWNLKIGFAFVPVFVAAWLLGAVPAMLVGGLGDFLGAVLFPIGPYFPGFTLSCALTGLVFGLLLHKKQSLPRIAAAVCVNQFGISLFLTTLWIYLLYGSASYWALVYTRLVQSAVLTVLELSVILTLSRGTLALRSRLVHCN